MKSIGSAIVCLIALLAVTSPASGQIPFPEVSTASYHIEVADVLVVKFRYTPEYDSTPTVQPDGYISLPMVGQVKVGGLTVSDAVSAIEAEGSKRLNAPEVTIELKEFQRPRFFVTGEVDKPGAFPLHGKMGVLEAIAMAGGFKRSAKHSQVTLFRRVDDTHMMGTILDAKAIAKSVDSRNVEIQPGDVLVVPENKLSKVTSIVPFAGALGSIGWFPSIVND